MALKEAPNAQARLDDLIARLGNSNPAFLEGFNPDYVNNVNNLYQNYVGQMTGLDTEETAARTGHERTLQDLLAQKTRGIESLRNRLASRGSLQSTAGIEAEADLLNQYETQQSDLGSQLSGLLSNISGRRLGLGGDYDVNLGALDRGLSTQAGEYIGRKAGEERDRATARQQGEANRLLGEQNAAIMNQQIPAMAPPPIDLTPYITAMNQRMTAAPTAPKPAAPPTSGPGSPGYVDPRVRDPLGQQATQLAKMPKSKTLTPWYGRR